MSWFISHWATDCPSASWRSLLDKASGATSSTKIKHEILRPHSLEKFRENLIRPIHCVHCRRSVSGAEKILDVFLTPPNYVLSWGQQSCIPAIKSVCRELSTPLESPDDLPDLLQGRLKVLLNGLAELLPYLSFLVLQELQSTWPVGTCQLPLLTMLDRIPPTAWWLL